MYKVLFCFSYLYLKLLCFEKGGLLFLILSYFTFLMSFMIIFVNNSYKFDVLFFFFFFFFFLGILHAFVRKKKKKKKANNCFSYLTHMSHLTL